MYHYNDIACDTEILEAFSTPPVSVMTKDYTATQNSTVSATDSQQCGQSTTVHHTSSVSSVQYTTGSVNSIITTTTRCGGMCKNK